MVDKITWRAQPVEKIPTPNEELLLQKEGW